MATILEWNEEERAGWERWVASRPPVVQQLARQFPPNQLYRLKTTGHRVTPYSYSEEGTLTVDITGQFNRVLFGRRVFGIRPEDLEECELPQPGEDLGDTAAEAGYTEDDVKKILIPRLREGRS